MIRVKIDEGNSTQFSKLFVGSVLFKSQKFGKKDATKFFK